MTREQALELLHKNMQNQNLRRHCYAVGAVMKALANRFKADVEKWGIVGLLHDGDYEKTKETPEKHTILMAEWLKEMGETDEEILSAILSHNYAHTGKNPPKNKLEWSLYCCDELTGFIVAVALVRPDKKLASVTVDSILKKWNQKSFAGGVKREQIEECQTRLGIPLEDFIQIALTAMQAISEDLGL
ncbi:MAG: HDIG domain-containing protein [Patescibacteria group bacterium]